MSETAASSAYGTCGGTATVAITPGSKPGNSAGSTATDSTYGPGTAARPSSSNAITSSTGQPPSSNTPMSASRDQSLRPGAQSPSDHARMTEGVSASASMSRSAPAKS